MKPNNIKKTKDTLSRILNRQENSSMVQFSAVKILSYLVNDMLDYAQLSAGQFRKFQCIFNLPDAINEIVQVMNYKAEELGIRIELAYQNFELK